MLRWKITSTAAMARGVAELRSTAELGPAQSQDMTLIWALSEPSSIW